MDWTLLLPQAAALLAMLAVSAFFAMSETAMIGVSRAQVRAKAVQGDARAKRLDGMLDEPERILTTVLVGNNIINIGATAFATVVGLEAFGAQGAMIATISMALLITVMTEIIPKTVAVQHAFRVAMLVAVPLRLLEHVLRPLVDLLTWLSRMVARAGGRKAPGKAPFLTSDEIEIIVRLGVEHGEVERFEQRVISEVFDFTDTDVHRIMTPADRVNFVHRDATLGAAADLAGRKGRTRIPVVDGDFDHVLGFVHIKDMLRYTDEELARLPVTHRLRRCLFATADMPADKLLQEMQREHCLLAVIQEAGNNIGIVTAEDLLEELVGEIHDEIEGSSLRAAAAKKAGEPPAPPAV